MVWYINTSTIRKRKNVHERPISNRVFDWMNDWGSLLSIYVCRWREKQSIIVFSFLFYRSLLLSIIGYWTRETLFVLFLRSTFRMRCLATERLLPFFSHYLTATCSLCLSLSRLMSRLFFIFLPREYVLFTAGNQGFANG
jgi:hypothetical protein